MWLINWIKKLLNIQVSKPTIQFTKPKRSVSRVFVHCSASDIPDHDNIETIREWHLNRGFNDVGYHYFITKSGELQIGRSLEFAPAAQKSHNRGTIAICVSGLEYFTPVSLDKLQQLCVAINKAYKGNVTFHGHREVSNKTCPVFDYKSLLQLDDRGKLGLPT